MRKGILGLIKQYCICFERLYDHFSISLELDSCVMVPAGRDGSVRYDREETEAYRRHSPVDSRRTQPSAVSRNWSVRHVTVDGGKRRLMLASLRYLDTFVKTDVARLFAERKLYVDWLGERGLSCYRSCGGPPHISSSWSSTLVSKRRGVRISSLSFLHTAQPEIIYGYFCLVQRRGERVS
jgi:hypothetical protein